MQARRSLALLVLLAVCAGGCDRIKAVKQRCLAGDVGACESACDKNVAGEGGCFEAGNAHRQKGALDYGSVEFKKARGYFEKSCDGGYGEGCLFAAQTIDAPYGPLDVASLSPDVAPKTISDADITERERLLVRACDLAPGASCKRLGDVLVGKNSPRAEVAYHKACASSKEPDACRAQRSKEVSTLEQWRSGCTRGVADDCTRLGDALYVVDAPRAVRLFVNECQLRGVESLAGGIGRFLAERVGGAKNPVDASRLARPENGSGGPRVTLQAPTVSGAVALVSVQRAFQMRSAELSDCVSNLPKTARGKVVAEAIVDLTGDVWRVKVTETTLAEAPTACLLSVLRGVGFGAPLAAPATLVLPMAIGADESVRSP